MNTLFINRAQLPRAALDRLNQSRENNQAAASPSSVDLFRLESRATQARAMMPPRRDLGSAALVKVQGETKQASEAEGEGKGGRQGGQERPSHSSYYSPVPVGGMAMPKRGSTIGDAVVQRDQAQRKRRSQTI